MEHKSFLEKLQSSDDRTKTRWVIGASAVATALVVAVWLSYFNSIVGQNPAAASAAAADTGRDFSFSKTARDGAAFLYQSIVGKIGAIGNAITKPREYMVKP